LLFDARQAVALRVGEGGEQDIGGGALGERIEFCEWADGGWVCDGFFRSARLAE
jgi:hypothetical protein